MKINTQNIILFLLRIAMGWVFLFAAYRQIPNSEWSAAGFLTNSSLFPSFFNFFTTPEILPIINTLIPWAHLFIGLGLFLGIGMRLASSGGATLMFLYYIPRLDGFMIGQNNFIVEYHLVYTLIIIYLFIADAGRVYGLEGYLVKFTKLHSLISQNKILRFILL